MNSGKRKAGILGGTLNPIHYGHLLIAEQAYYRFELDYVLFMPSGNPPHKTEDVISAGIHRENMTKLASADNPHFQYSDMELNREGFIYTSDTLRILCREHPDTEYYFILGADSLFSLEQWHEPEEVFKRCVIIAAGRPDSFQPEFQSEQDIFARIQYLKQKYHCRIHYMDSPLFEVSSSAIRTRISNGESVRYLIPPDVERYINEHDLYNI